MPTEATHTYTYVDFRPRGPRVRVHRQFGEKVMRRIMRASVGHYSPRDVRSGAGWFFGGKGIWRRCSGVITRARLSMSDASVRVRFGEITGFARKTRADVSKLGSDVVPHVYMYMSVQFGDKTFGKRVTMCAHSNTWTRGTCGEILSDAGGRATSRAGARRIACIIKRTGARMATPSRTTKKKQSGARIYFNSVPV